MVLIAEVFCALFFLVELKVVHGDKTFPGMLCLLIDSGANASILGIAASGN